MLLKPCVSIIKESERVFGPQSKLLIYAKNNIVYATGLTDEDMNKAQVGISSV